MKNLAKTIIIKMSDEADAMNQKVRQRAGTTEAVNDSYPESWVYYMNVCGLYHESNEVMKVISMDTREEITFTQENLKIHRATAREYAYGTRGYELLVQTYPDQELLILGILNPADMQTAINAKDGTIISYPTNLVEANEYSLMQNLQGWIYKHIARWYNRHYLLSDSLYFPVFLAQMHMFCYWMLKNFREQAARTNEAHSYHVQEFLSSHSGLAEYVPMMNLEQRLWLYRNIEFIEHNSGVQATFKKLIDHIMTARNIPLGEFVMRHDTTEQPTEINSKVFFRKNAINTAFSADTTDVFSLNDMLDKEAPLARDNELIRVDGQAAMEYGFTNSISNVMMTKALESNMVDFSNSERYPMEPSSLNPFEGVLLNHWAYLSSIGYYNTFIGLVNPRTGENIPLSAKEAFIFAMYLFFGQYGIKLHGMPQIIATRVQRLPIPSVDDMMGVVQTKRMARQFAEFAHDLQPDIYPMISTEAFYNKCQEIHTAANTQYKLAAMFQHPKSRAQAKAMIARLYSDNVVTMDDPSLTYAQWFSARNINISDFATDEMGDLFRTLLKSAVGLDLSTTNSVANIQKAMVGMLGQLSSYSIQFMSSINSSTIKKLGWSPVAIGDVDGQLSDTILLDSLDVGVKRNIYGMIDAKRIDLPGYGLELKSSLQFHDYTKTRIKTRVRLAKNAREFLNTINIGTNRVKYAMPTQPNPHSVIPVLGLDYWLKLPVEEQQQIADGNGNPWWYTPPADIDLADILKVTWLNGLVWSRDADTDIDLANVLVVQSLDGLSYVQS